MLALRSERGFKLIQVSLKKAVQRCQRGGFGVLHYDGRFQEKSYVKRNELQDKRLASGLNRQKQAARVIWFGHSNV